MEDYNPSITVSAVTVLVGLLNFAAGGCLLLTIVKFKKLRTRTNFFIFHIIIASLLYEIVDAIAYNTYQICYSAKNRGLAIGDACVFLKTKDLCLLLLFSFSNFLGVDWYLSTCKKQFLSKFNSLYKYVIIAIYVMNTLGYGLSYLKSCEEESYMIYVSYALSFLQAASFNIMNCIRKPNAEVSSGNALLISSIVVFVCVPSFGSRLVLLCFRRKEVSYFTFWTAHVMDAIIDWFVCYVPIYVIFVLLRRDKFFGLAFNKIFKRQKISLEEENELECRPTTDRQGLS